MTFFTGVIKVSSRGLGRNVYLKCCAVRTFVQNLILSVKNILTFALNSRSGPINTFHQGTRHNRRNIIIKTLINLLVFFVFFYLPVQMTHVECKLFHCLR